MPETLENNKTLVLVGLIGPLVLLVNIMGAPNVLVEARIEFLRNKESLNSELRFPEDVNLFCGYNDVTRIIGGNDSRPGAWPWQVSLSLRGEFHCGGSILNRDWVVTAAHCVIKHPQDITIRVGKTDITEIDRPGEHSVYQLKEVYLHPGYVRRLHINDIALIYLNASLEFSELVKPICLPPEDVELIGRDAVVTGWGATKMADDTNPKPKYPKILQELQVPIIDNNDCSKVFQIVEPPPETYLCAGFFDEGGRDSCKGDSGGPLVVRSSVDRWFLAGVVSFGTACALPKLPGVYTKVSYYNSWIIATINLL